MAAIPSDNARLSLSKLRHSIEERLEELRQKDELNGDVQSILDDLATYQEILEEREQSIKGTLVNLVDDMSQTSQTLSVTGTRLDAILEAAEDVAFIITDKDDISTIVEFSAGAELVFGFTRHEVIGKSAAMLCPPEQDIPEDEHVCSFVSHPRRRVLMERKNGQVFPALYSAYPLKDNNGEITASLIIVLDVAKQEMAEKLLRESHTRYRALAMASPISIITFDTYGVVTFINDWHIKMMGGERTDAALYLGRRLEDMPCLVRAGVDDLIEPALRGEPVTLEDVRMPAFGARPETWHNIRIAPLMLEGESLGGILIMEDITRRKQTELNLKLLIDSSPIPLLRIEQTDQGGIISYLNPEAKAMFGPQALGKPVDDFIIPREDEDAEITSMHGERCEVVATDGPRQAIRASHSPSGQAEVQAVLDVGVLLEAKEAAEDASRTKSDFLANISHEIRTPLNALLGMLQLLQEEDLGDDINELTGYATGAANSLLTLLNDILDFSVIEARALALDELDFKLAELVEMVVTPYRIEAANKGIELDSTIESCLPEALFGDARRLRQIIFHVLGNAVKFTDKGKVAIRVQCRPATEEDAIPVAITIEDSGIGMTEEQIKRVFEPFRQADGSRTRRHGGTGIGMALVQEFVSAMDGRVEVESEPGAGTRVTIFLSFQRATIAPSVA